MKTSALGPTMRRPRPERGRASRRGSPGRIAFFRRLRNRREDLVASLICGFVSGSLFTYVPDIALRARASALFTYASTMTLPVIEHHALHGDWNISAKPVQGHNSLTLTGLSEGVAHASGDEGQFGRTGATVLLRPAGMDVPDGPPVVIWLCGDEALPPGWSGPLLDQAGSKSRGLSNSLCQRPMSS